MPDSIDRGHIRGSPAGGHASTHGHIGSFASPSTMDQAETAPRMWGHGH
jgi:hypothetical protein